MADPTAKLSKINPGDYQIPVLPANAKAEYLARYVCSNCYGHLVALPVDGGFLVNCPNCGLNQRGYVTKSYARARRQESFIDAAEVRHNLKDLFPSPHAGKSKEELLKELGF